MAHLDTAWFGPTGSGGVLSMALNANGTIDVTLDAPGAWLFGIDTSSSIQGTYTVPGVHDTTIGSWVGSDYPGWGDDSFFQNGSSVHAATTPATRRPFPKPRPR